LPNTWEDVIKKAGQRRLLRAWRRSRSIPRQ